MADSPSKPAWSSAQPVPREERAMPVSPVPASHAPAGPAPAVPRWLRQIERMLAVLVRLYLGLALCFVPWFRPLWDNNPLFLHAPSLLPLLTSGAVRGLVSGLGLLNLWLAIDGAIRSSKEWES